VIGAHAMIDVSDGLAFDLHRLADASGVGFVLDDVPVAEGATLEEALGAVRTTSWCSLRARPLPMA
jgi:thiamine monophosphate kinase